MVMDTIRTPGLKVSYYLTVTAKEAPKQHTKSKGGKASTQDIIFCLHQSSDMQKEHGNDPPHTEIKDVPSQRDFQINEQIRSRGFPSGYLCRYPS